MNLYFDEHLVEGYHSKSQQARILTEGWVAQNIYCPVCGQPSLRHYEANRPVADFCCDECKSEFELKSKDGAFGDKVVDGQYDTMISRIQSFNNPHFFFLSYHEDSVNNFFFVPNHFFTPSLIERRKPLSDTARRAGWTGCNILIQEIPSTAKIFLVHDAQVVEPQKVIEAYKRTEAFISHDLNSRGWIIDLLRCVELIPKVEFSLSDVYAYEAMLQQKHPDNNNVRPKIRQQLQVLRDKGIIEFTSRGNYRKTGF